MTFEEWVDSKFKNEKGEFMRGYVPENRLDYCLWGTTVRILKKVWEEAQDNK